MGQFVKQLSYNTPYRTLNAITIGDEIIDEYNSHGKVVKIIKNKNNRVVEFIFKLDNKQIIYILKDGN